VAEGSQGSLPDESIEQLRQVLASYERALVGRGPDGRSEDRGAEAVGPG
jgi:hypothetical protein